MKHSVSILLATIVNLICSPPLTWSLNITEKSASEDTEQKYSAPPFPGRITLTEIAFKNSEQDYFVFQADSSAQRINLKGLQFYDDRDFKTIENDFWVNSGAQIKLSFNSTDADSGADGQLFSDKKGLTSTTEQLYIHYGNEPLAFFCWVKSPVAKSEIADFQKIYPEAIWDDAEIENCFPAETVKNNQILKKYGNENNAGSWSVQPEEDNADEGLSGSSTTENSSTAEKSSGSAGKSSSKDSSDLNDIIAGASDNPAPDDLALMLTEIFPAPAGKEDFEWIEVLYTGAGDLDLEGWIVDDSEGGSKPKRLTGTVARAGIPTVINLKTHKINLNNDQDLVRLFQPDGTPVFEQDYDSVKKGFSYSLITVDDEEHWEWTKDPSPGELNPVLESVTGTLILPAQFSDQYFFALENEQKQKYMVTFTEDLIKAPLAKQIFLQGATGTFTGQISDAPANDNGYLYILNLSNYELAPAESIPLSWPPLLLIVTIPLLALGSYLLVKKPWNPLPSDNY